MPRIKPLEEYPDEYLEAFQRALKEGSFTVECESHDAAKRLRGHLYSFRAVLRQSNAYEELSKHVDDIMLVLDGKNLVLTVREGYGASTLREALEHDS